MKKSLAILCIVIPLATLLTACGKFKCERCGIESDSAKYKVMIDGEKTEVCESCKELLDLQNQMAQIVS